MCYGHHPQGRKIVHAIVPAKEKRVRHWRCAEPPLQTAERKTSSEKEDHRIRSTRNKMSSVCAVEGMTTLFSANASGLKSLHCNNPTLPCLFSYVWGTKSFITMKLGLRTYAGYKTIQLHLKKKKISILKVQLGFCCSNAITAKVDLIIGQICDDSNYTKRGW